MTRAFVTAAFLAALGGCAEDACRGADTKYYNEAVRYHLDKRGVAYRVSGPVTCVPGRNGGELRAAEAEVDASFHEIAFLLKDSCEERAFDDWAKRKLRFEIRSTLDSRDQPSRRMFLLRSFTREEVASNRARLEKTGPKGATCRGTG